MDRENSRDKLSVDIKRRIANLRPVTEYDPDHLNGRINFLSSSGFPPLDHVPKLPHLGGTPSVNNTPKSVRIGLHKYLEWRGEHMYDIKLMFLQSLLRRREEAALDKYVGAMRKLVDKALSCYEPPTDFEGSPNSDQFVEMLLLDSCFLVELFRKSQLIGPRRRPDDAFDTVMRILDEVQCDLVYFKNQLPFSVLQEFFEISKIPDEDPDECPEKDPDEYLKADPDEDPHDPLIELALKFFKVMGDGFFPRRDEFNLIPSHPNPNPKITQPFPNLLGLIYYCLPKPELTMESVMEEEEVIIHLEEAWGLRPTIESLERERELVHCATELENAGIGFKKGKDDGDILNIKFEKGKGEMLIPHLQIAKTTVELLRNLSEYEKQFPISRPRFVNEYVKFMQCLVNSPKDVELLRQKGIIERSVGHDGIVCSILNQMGSQAKISHRLVYHDVIGKVNDHCRHRRNKWMAKFWKDYFNSPWSLISFLAALFLILLTVTQTVFAIVSYAHPPT